MTRSLYLNVGCGKVKLSGFVNIDLEHGADIQCDVTQGLPFGDATVDGIYSEHFIEHLSQKDILGFLRECRRVLKPGGRVRIATPDLSALVTEYESNDWRQPWLDKYGYSWVKNRAEYLNISMREWGHKWLVDEEELSRLADWAGLEQAKRCNINDSTDPHLARLETRTESTLIMEYTQHIEAIEDNPLVSIIVPAYRADFLSVCLESALAQTYRRIEILILDDCPGDDVRKIAQDFVQRDSRVAYHPNALPLGEPDNLTQGIRLAQGVFIKPLYDDDLLEPDAVERLLHIYREHPAARLAAGSRLPIDASGQTLDKGILGPPLSVNDGLLRGTQVIGQILSSGLNSLGEPTCMMFRRSDALRIDEPNVMTLFGRLCFGAGDVCLALHLLSRGDLAYLSAPVARFRMHAGQTQKQKRSHELGLASWQYLRQQAERFGLMAKATQTPTPISTTPEPLSRPVLPWLADFRLLPDEANWAQDEISRWESKNAGDMRASMALLLHPEISAHSTRFSIAKQWFSGVSVDIAASSDSEQRIASANTALLSQNANWLGLIDAGDQLAPDALFRIAHAVREHPQWQIVYTDEDQITADGQHTNPHCKPDFNLDYLRSLPYVGGLLLIRRDLFTALGGFDPQAEGAEDYDLMLRAWEHLQRSGAGEAAIGHVPEVLYHRLQGSGHTQKSVPEILQAGESALQRHFERLGIAAQVQPGPFPPSFRVRWPLPEARPLVSILIPTRDQLPLLQRCVESVIEKTKYPAYEILIIDNDSQAPEARNYLAAIEAKEAELGGRLRVVRQPGPFNFSAMNNAAARAARGDYLLLLNNDTAALHDDWLDEMMSHAVRPDVGIVGAKLLYPDGKIQHAGVILGLRGPAEHPFIGRPPEDRGYFGRAQLTQDLSAVTGACLLVRKSVYEQLGGLDEQAFKVSYNDIDLCLKVREVGLRIVFTPYALLMHEGSASQKSGTETQPDDAKLKRFAAEKDAMYAKWLPQLAFDPAYNRHLSLASTDFLLDDQPCLSWDPAWRPRPRVLVHSADREGCGEYRIIAPMRALNRAGLTQGWETMRLFEPAEMERMQPDSLVVQRQMEWPQIEALERHARTSKAFRVFEIDDLITNLPHKSVHKGTIHKDIAKRFRKAAGLCNRLVVATEPLAKAYAHFTDEVVVQPNYLEAARWGHLQPPRAERSKPRVGWAGGVGHTGDLELIANLVRDTASEVDWVFFGLCPEALKPLVKEFHPGVPLDQYAAKLAALDLDLAVAPLEDNAFNEAKSHLRLLEYGILGYPVICSDLTPYQGDFPVTRVANRYRDWTRAVRDAVADRATLRAQGDALRAKVLADWMMEDHLDTWLKAWLR